MKEYSIYWIYREWMDNPFEQGYVGLTKSIDVRKRSHFNKLKREGHANPYLQNVWNKYQDLQFKVLMENLTREEAQQLEIDYRPTECIGYNISIGGFSPEMAEETKVKLSKAHMGKVHTPLARQRMSESKAKLYQGKGNPFYGKKHSDESKRKMSESSKNSFTDEMKKRYSEARTGKGHRKVLCVETGVVYDGPKIASKAVGLKSDTGIIDVCKNRIKTSGGFRWKYIT